MTQTDTGWEKKLSAVSGFLAAVLVPLALGFLGNFYSSAQQASENLITEREQKRAWVQIALDILRDENADDALKQWAIDVVNKFSDVPFNQATQNVLLQGGAVLPAPTAVPEVALATGSRIAEMNRLQTVGVSAALQQDLQGAITAYDAAYKLWAVFRNVDEIRRALHGLAERTPDQDPTSQEWQALYRVIDGMDLRGVPDEIREGLRKESM